MRPSKLMCFDSDCIQVLSYHYYQYFLILCSEAIILI